MGGEESDYFILPMKRGKRPQATPWREGGNGMRGPLEGKTSGRQGRIDVSTKLQRIAEQARRRPGEALTTLAHHIDVDFLREAFRRTRKSAAPGVDGQTAQKYAVDLEAKLESLHERFKSGSYKAPPVRRVYIPKGGNRAERRPIGIPTFEDKVLQRAVAMVLNAVYEQDFLDCSYGFRSGRSPRMAMKSLRMKTMKMEGGWVLEIDIRSYFDNIDPRHLRSFLDLRVRDGVIRRMIDKWLKAGIMEDDAVRHPDTGTPQGGVISPILSNIYLHEVLDRWFEEEVKPRLRGNAHLCRYADDAVIVFERHEDAQRVLDVLPKRFGRYGLELHPDKTRLVRFINPDHDQDGKPGTFDFMGFTFHWGYTRGGRAVVKTKTAAKRLRRSLKAINQWCRNHRHLPLDAQHQLLSDKVRGHFRYYGVPGNSRAMCEFHHWVRRLWKRWLGKRSQRAKFTWQRWDRFEERYPLPTAQVHA
jgi:group II intron reverse transcriptase/maturase